MTCLCKKAVSSFFWQISGQQSVHTMSSVNPGLLWPEVEDACPFLGTSSVGAD